LLFKEGYLNAKGAQLHYNNLGSTSTVTKHHNFKPCTELLDQSPYKYLSPSEQDLYRINYHCLDTSNVHFNGGEVKGEGFMMSIYDCDPNTYLGTCKTSEEIAEYNDNNYIGFTMVSFSSIFR
jgi:hypothetical protein